MFDIVKAFFRRYAIVVLPWVGLTLMKMHYDPFISYNCKIHGTLWHDNTKKVQTVQTLPGFF